MKYFILLLMFNISYAKCDLISVEKGECDIKPCISMVTETFGDFSRVVSCSKIFVKKNGKLVFDHYELVGKQITRSKNGTSVSADIVEIRDVR